MKRAYTLFFLLFLRCVMGLGQQVCGRVTDIQGKPLQAATINIHWQDDKSHVGSVSSDSSGLFIFKDLAIDRFYRVRVSLIGFETWSKDSIGIGANSTVELDVLMVPKSSNLEEVSVTAERPYIEKRSDRTVITPDVMLTGIGGTAFEALEKSPGVQLDRSGNIRLSGKAGVSVYVDDRPAYLTGEELKGYLRSIPLAQIDRIELMTNPPSNYDAAGNGGIIVLHTKRYRSRGVHGGASLAYQQGRYGRTINSADIAINREKWAMAASSSLSTTNTYTDLDILREFGDGQVVMSPIFSQNTWIRRKGISIGGRLGTDYFLDESNTFGINLSLQSSPIVLESYVESWFMTSSEILDSILQANNREDRTFSNLGTNFNYRYKKPGSEQKLTVDLDYLVYNGNNEQYFDNTTYLSSGEPIALESQFGKVPNDIRIYSVKADLIHPVGNALRVSTGLKSSRTMTDNDADFYRILEEKLIVDLEKTNHFRFRESIHAAYVNMDGKYGNWNYQAGLRFEGTISGGHQLGNGSQPDSSFNRRNMDFFPTLYLQYRPSGESKHAVSMNYGRRVDRPHYAWLNPFVTPFDKYTYYIGTPYLKPSYIQQAELAYNFQPLLDLTLAYGKVSDLMSETIRIQDGVYYSQQDNLGLSTTMSATLNLSYVPLKGLTLNCHAAIHSINTKSEIFGQNMDTRGTYRLVRPTITYKLSERWSFQVDGEYQGSQKFAQFTMKERIRANTAINFKMNSICSFNLAITDLLHSDINAGDIGYLGGAYATFSTVRDTRFVNLSLRYRFTKGTKNDRNYQGGGAQSEQQRTG
ncbi:TonB-dependent receptor [Sphingobacterium pedocola]|uniref:TonB-dependent receptor n=1 Tax=Sphingobacterium pedocola TaxID=2082722 RepID=UPI0018CAC489|nr:TonB-dependent receptor [Sphingobacterium pedocola]